MVKFLQIVRIIPPRFSLRVADIFRREQRAITLLQLPHLRSHTDLHQGNGQEASFTNLYGGQLQAHQKQLLF